MSWTCRRYEDVYKRQYIGSLLLINMEKDLNVGSAGCDDHCIEPSCQELADLLLFQIGVFFRRRDDQVIIVLAKSL